MDLSIIDIVNDEVQKIAKEMYKNDKCKPVFMVSVFTKEEKEDTIMLTVTHSGHSFSKIIFPKKNCYYGYSSLEDEISGLYNRTM
jgi:hypothetical protein